jgi:hypothetical protein
MSEHTKEPWMYTGKNQNATHDIWSSNKLHFISAESSEPDATRIVSCVNACAGIDDPAAELAAIRADNQRMCEALEEIAEQKTWVNLDDRHGTQWDYWKMRTFHLIEIARAALGKE